MELQESRRDGRDLSKQISLPSCFPHATVTPACPLMWPATTGGHCTPRLAANRVRYASERSDQREGWETFNKTDLPSLLDSCFPHAAVTPTWSLMWDAATAGHCTPRLRANRVGVAFDVARRDGRALHATTIGESRPLRFGEEASARG